jgi:ATPase complex subunit ATP10
MMMITAAKRPPRTILQHYHTHNVGSATASSIQRFFASSSPPDRIPGIQVSPESIGAQIVPGGKSVIKKDPKTGVDRFVMVERAYGYFWMINDLTKPGGSKPIVANTALIPAEEARDFSTLMNLNVLDTDESVDIPAYFLRNNRAMDPSAQCTLVTMAYKEYGYKLLPSWTDPFEQAFGLGNPRAQAVRVSITEGKFTRMLLSSLMKRNFRSSTPAHIQPQTLLCFGPNEEELKAFNDTLRIHNTLTAYVFLLDGLGRVRFAGSGEASQEEANRLVAFAKELTPRLNEGDEASTGKKAARKGYQYNNK